MKKPKSKIICSFNGSFTRRRPSEKLNYTGGETRIISVDRTITFSRLTARISELMKCPKQAFYLNYMITDSENEEKDSSLALIESDDDVRCMIEGFEKLEFRGKYYRLWIYVCDDDDEFVNLVNLSKLRNVVVNDVDACDKVKYSDECLRKISKLRNVVVNNNVDACDKVKYSDECLRKVVLKQQLVAKKSEFMKRCFRELGLGSEEGKVERGRFSDENCDDFRSPRFGSSLCRSSRDKVECDYDDDKCRESRSYVDSVCHSRGMSVKEREDYECDDDNCVESRSYVDSVCHFRTLNVKDGEEDKCDDENCVESRSYVDLVALSASHSRLLDSKDMVDYKCDDVNLTERRSYADLAALSVCHSRSVDQKDTVDYKYDDDNFMESRSYADSVLLSASHSRPSILKDREVGVGISESDSTFVNAADARKQRIYYTHSISNPSNFTEVGNHRKVSLNGRLCLGKFYPGIQSSSVILKQGKVVSQCILNNLTCSFAFPSGSEGNISDNDSAVSQDRNTNPERQFSYHDPPPTIADQSFPSLVDAEKFLVCAEGVNTQIDFLSNGVQKQHTATNQQDVANISSSLNKMELECNAKLLKIGAVCESFSKNQSGALITHGSVNLSSHNLSLLSLDGLESPAHSSSGYFSDTSVRPQTMALHLMGQEHFGTDPQAQITNEAVSFLSSDKVMEENKQEAVLQENVESTLSIEKKDEIKKTCNESKANGQIPPEIITIYNHLAIGELQAIKNSDLEYIKELGSGTYGTVFYGKWKGSDVAIKKLKPGFFNGGAVEENRLIADFWKEAHILGQLRHPNIVALYGVVTDGPATNLATVTEFMINGSLKQVFRRKDRTIDRRKRLILAMDVAFGMEYLHEKNIVHFDLKSHNLLVNMRDPRRPVCKIGDLGLSKIKQKTLVSGGVRGTIPWMAPELLSCKNLVTEKVDVFSFGIVMWELLTGEEPYSGMRSHEIIAGIIKGTLRPETPAWCDPAWRSLMEKCWSTDPANRPTFSEIAKELRTMAAAMNIK